MLLLQLLYNNFNSKELYMLQLAGNKVLFNKSGIEFDENKPDKYFLIAYALELYISLLNDYEPNVLYKHDTNDLCTDKDELNKLFFTTFGENLEIDFAQDAQEKVEKLKNDAEHRQLTPDEIEIYKANVDLMKGYIIQREINKSAFYTAIEKIVQLIKKNRINEIHLPILNEFSRVIVAIQGVLLEKKVATETKAEVDNKDGYIKFSINI